MRQFRARNRRRCGNRHLDIERFRRRFRSDHNARMLAAMIRSGQGGVQQRFRAA